MEDERDTVLPEGEPSQSDTLEDAPAESIAPPPLYLRIKEFVRPLLPAQPGHWLFLAATFLFLIAAGNLWEPVRKWDLQEEINRVIGTGASQPTLAPKPWFWFPKWALCLLSASGALLLSLGVFRRRGLLFWGLVAAPALGAIAIYLARIAHFVSEASAGTKSLYGVIPPEVPPRTAWEIILLSGDGFWAAIAGILFTGIGFLLVQAGRVSLPLAFLGETVQQADPSAASISRQRLLFFLLGVFLLPQLVTDLFALPLFLILDINKRYVEWIP